MRVDISLTRLQNGDFMAILRESSDRRGSKNGAMNESVFRAFFCAAPVPMFVLRDFKARKRRKDKTAVRLILLDDRMLRLLARLARKQLASPDAFVFLNAKGQPWSANAVRCRMMRLRKRLGLEPDENGENVVAYTLRHTSASTPRNRPACTTSDFPFFWATSRDSRRSRLPTSRSTFRRRSPRSGSRIPTS